MTTRREDMMSQEDNKALVRRFLEEVMNGRNVLAISTFMVPGSRFAGAFEGFVTHHINVGFPDLHLTIEGLFAEGDQVLVQTTLRATQTGPALGHPPTGEACTTMVIYLFTITNGKIASGQWLLDRMELAQQLGWMSTPARAPTPDGGQWGDKR